MKKCFLFLCSMHSGIERCVHVRVCVDASASGIDASGWMRLARDASSQMRLSRDASSWMHLGVTHLPRCIYTDAYMDASFDSAMYTKKRKPHKTRCKHLRQRNANVQFFAPNQRIWRAKVEKNIYQKTKGKISAMVNKRVHVCFISTMPLVLTPNSLLLFVFLTLHCVYLTLKHNYATATVDCQLSQ